MGAYKHGICKMLYMNISVCVADLIVLSNVRVI